MELEEKTGVENEETPASEEQTLEEMVAEEEPEEETVAEDEPEGDDTPPESEPEENQERTVPVKVIQRERQRRREAEAREKELNERLSELEERMTTAQQHQSQLNKPTMDQFDGDYEAYSRELESYLEKKAEMVAVETADKRVQERTIAEAEKAREEEIEKRRQEFYRRLDKAGEKYEDFEDSYNYVHGLTELNIGIAKATVDSENVGDLVNYLAKHPEEAEKIAGLSETAAIKAIGAIEGKISAPPPKPKKTTQAPKPVNPVGGSADPSQIKFSHDMNPKDRREVLKKAEEAGLTMEDLLGG